MTKETLHYINEKLDFGELLTYLEISFRDGGSHISCACPLHGGDNPSAFVWYHNNKRWQCFTHACHGDTPKSVFDFIMQLRECSFRESVDFISNFCGIKTDKLSQSMLMELRAELEGKKFIKEQEEKEIKIPQDLGIENATVDYSHLARRNFTPSVQKDFGAMLCTNGQLAKRIVFPIEDIEGRTIGYAGRTINGSDRKWMYTKSCQIGKILYNLNHAKVGNKTNTFILSEGILDIIRLYQCGYKNGVASLSANLTRKQKQLILENMDVVYLAYDGDEAGQNAQKKIGDALKKFGSLEIYSMTLPKGKDLGDLTKGDIDLLIKNAGKVS